MTDPPQIYVWLSTKIGAKLLSDLVIFSILSSDIPFISTNKFV